MRKPLFYAGFCIVMLLRLLDFLVFYWVFCLLLVSNLAALV